MTKQREPLAELEQPTGWVVAQIADVVCEVQTTDPSKEPNAEITYFDISSIDNEAGTITSPKVIPGGDAPSRARQIVHAGDVLFSTVRPNLRAVAMVPDVRNGIASTGFCVLRAEKSVRPKYLYYFVRSEEFLDGLLPLQRGVSYPAVRSGDVLAQSIPLPPFAEQTRIVEKLEELLTDLDAGVAELKAARKKLAQYRQSLLKAAVEGALTAEWRQSPAAVSAEPGAALLARILRERRTRWEVSQLAKFQAQGKTPPKGWQAKYPEPVAPDTTDLPELPEGWVWTSVDQCSLDEAAVTDGPFGSNLKSSHYKTDGPRVIRLQNIGDGVFVDARAHIAESHYQELLKHAVETDDVIVAMLGEVLPRACLIPSGVSPAIVKADCARVRVNKDLLKPAVLMAQLNSKPIRDYVIKFVKGIGRPRVNLGNLRAIPVALCSTDEQSQIDAELRETQRSIDEQLYAIERGLRYSAAQRKNILQAAFLGQLVRPDPTDEPASALLERIRVERATRLTQSTARRRAAKKK